MRHIFTTICLISLLSCSDGSRDPAATAPDTTNPNAAIQTGPAVSSAEDFAQLNFTDLIYIPKDSADKLISHGKGNNCKKAQGVTTYFTKADIQQLTSIPGVTSFRLVFGCFLGTAPGDKKNRPTLLLEVEFSGIGLVPSYIYYSSRRICPLPENCN